MQAVKAAAKKRVLCDISGIEGFALLLGQSLNIYVSNEEYVLNSAKFGGEATNCVALRDFAMTFRLCLKSYG